MADDKENDLLSDIRGIAPMAIALVVILTAAVVASYAYAKKQTGTIILPAGVTYLGPTPTPPPPSGAWIPIPSNVSWGTQKGKRYPYSFSFPTNLALGVFPGDPFDPVTIFWGNTNPSENIFFRVENLNEMQGTSAFIDKPKIDYASFWWKQYNWKGVATVTQFTNSKGLVGYRAKYLNSEGKTLLDNIFFEVPGRPELVIWMASKLIDSTTFDRMADSLAWNETLPTP